MALLCEEQGSSFTGVRKAQKEQVFKEMTGGMSLCFCSSLSTRKDRCETIKEVERNKDSSKMPSLAVRSRSFLGMYLVIILHEQYSILIIQTVS